MPQSHSSAPCTVPSPQTVLLEELEEDLGEADLEDKEPLMGIVSLDDDDEDVDANETMLAVAEAFEDEEAGQPPLASTFTVVLSQKTGIWFVGIAGQSLAFSGGRGITWPSHAWFFI